jgi:glycosyltransferase involved in cell wall biosynthesis
MNITNYLTKKISCLTATYGRYRVLSEAVTCFYEQDYSNKELIILNNHPAPLVCHLPQVMIINEPGYPSLGDCRNRLLELATGEYVRTWDDDDLYLPTALSQGIEYIRDYPAWKPARSWSWRVEQDIMTLNSNTYEASWTVRADVARKYGYGVMSGGNEHNVLHRGINTMGGVRRDEVEPTYVYRWASGLCRISGTLNKNDLSDETTRRRTARWMGRNNDTGDGRPIEPVDLTKYWERIERARNDMDKNTDETAEDLR